jgi:hypothetical protein
MVLYHSGPKGQKMCCMISQSTGRPRLSSCPVFGTRPIRPEECMYERRSSANSKRAHSAGHRTSVCVCVRAHDSTISGMSAKMDGWSSPLCSPRQPMLWPGLACCMAAAPSPAWGTLLWADALKPCDVLAGANTNPSKAMVHRHTCTHACTHTQPTHTHTEMYSYFQFHMHVLTHAPTHADFLVTHARTQTSCSNTSSTLPTRIC